MDKKKEMKPSRWLMRQQGVARRWVWLAVACGLAMGVLIVIQSGLLAWIIDQAFIQHQGLAVLKMDIVWLLLVFVLRAVLVWAKHYFGFQAGAAVRLYLRMAIIRHVGSLGPIVGRQWRTGEVVSSALEQVEALQDFFAFYLPQMMLAVMIPLGFLVVVFRLNWIAGLILLITAPLIPLFMALIGMGAASLNQKHFQAMARMSAHFLDVLQGMTTLKLFDRAQAQVKVVERVSDQLRQKTMSVLKVAFLSSAVLELFAAMSIALLATYLGLSFLGDIHLGRVEPLTLFIGLFILLLAPEFFLPLRELGTHYHARAAAVGAAEEIQAILSVPLPEQGESKTLPVAPWQLHFDQVSFHYSGRNQVTLQPLDLSIAPGEHVAIVGPSGAGKTTILNLLLGFLQPLSGSITINDVPLAAIDQGLWLQQVAWLGQLPRLFQGSIADNIALGDPDASDEEIMAAAKAARVWHFAEALPLGLDTKIGEQQFGLSGGQAQRVALARAYLKDAPILLLDEPTAHLDAATANEVRQSIEVLCRNKTVISVTHRLDTLAAVDKIVVLDQGIMVESGRFEVLAAKGGLFSQMLKSQGGAV